VTANHRTVRLIILEAFIVGDEVPLALPNDLAVGEVARWT
jgi:hypothetical protein